MLPRVSKFVRFGNALKAGITTTAICHHPRGARQSGDFNPEHGFPRERDADDEEKGRRLKTSFGSIRYDQPTHFQTTATGPSGLRSTATLRTSVSTAPELNVIVDTYPETFYRRKPGEVDGRTAQDVSTYPTSSVYIADVAETQGTFGLRRLQFEQPVHEAEPRPQRKWVEDLNPIDEEYFGEYVRSSSAAENDSALCNRETSDPLGAVERSNVASPPLDEIDDQYFGNYFSGDKNESSQASLTGLNLFGGTSEVIHFRPKARSSSSPAVPSVGRENLGTEVTSNMQSSRSPASNGSEVSALRARDSAGRNDIDASETAELRTIINEPKLTKTVVFNVEEPSTAFDYAMKLRMQERTEKEIASTKFGLDWWKMTRDEIYRILHASVIYNDNDIVAFDKPYGISCQGGGRGDLSFLSKHLDRLGSALGAQDGQLHYIHRLDKGCTGVVVYAKTPEMAALLRSSFAQRKVIKIYWAILKGTPDPPEGIIDIPMSEGRIGTRHRMVLRPVFDRPGGFKKIGSSARTYYKVLNSRGSAALVELRPETGLKHQLRVHTSFALSCGILGDHKYAHREKFAPQALNGDILAALGIRSQDVRDLPLHLHAKCLVFPELLDGRNLFIQAEVPKGFKKTMRKLRLRAP